MIEFLVKLLVMVQLLALMMGLFGQFSGEIRALWLQFAGGLMLLLLMAALWSLWAGAWVLLLPYVAALCAVTQVFMNWRRSRSEWRT